MENPELEILNEVILESKDHLINIEPDLLLLEEQQSQVSQEVINRIFRAVHSIKGGFGFFGLKNITELSHKMENIFSMIKKKKLVPDSDLIDVLLKGVDKIKVLLDHIQDSDSIDISEELEQLKPFMAETKSKVQSQSTDDGSQLSASDLRGQVKQLSDQDLDLIVDGSLFLYEVKINSNKDWIEKKKTPKKNFEEWRDFSKILTDIENLVSIKSLKKVPQNEVITVYLTSVLDPDIIAKALEINDDQIKRAFIDPDKKNLNENDTEILNSIDSDKQPNIKSSKRVESIKESEVIKVKVDHLNNLVNLAGELVLGRNQIKQKINNRLFDFKEFDRLKETLDHSFKKINHSLKETNDVDRQINERNIKREFENIKNVFASLMLTRLTDIPGLNPLVQNIDRITTGLQEKIMQTRMQPISTVFRKFPRITRDISKKIGKKVDLIIEGETVELDKSIIEALSDPLNHLIRNSIDHGVESPEERREVGKSDSGKIWLDAFHEGGKVIIEIADDGAGINTEKIKEKALSLNLYSHDEIETMSENELFMLIFSSGFSTKKEVSDISGRGVGMDVVKTNIERLGGVIDIESKIGEGTKFIMKLPLTLAIIPSLLITVQKRRYAIPQIGIEELVRVRGSDIHQKIKRIQNAEVLRLRDKLLPLVYLSDILGIERKIIHPETGEELIDRRNRLSPRRKEKQQHSESNERRGLQDDRRKKQQKNLKVVVLKMANRRFGLVVDDISNSEEIVVKPLSYFLKKCKYYSGCTILGDGTVAMILDINGLAESSGLQLDTLEQEFQNEMNQVSMEEEVSEILVFDNGQNESFATTIDSISRIEKISSKDIVSISNKVFYKYEDRSIRLLNIHDYLPFNAYDELPSDVYLILPKKLDKKVGIIACQVEDVIETMMNLDDSHIKAPGILGSMIINSKMVFMIDLIELIRNCENYL